MLESAIERVTHLSLRLWWLTILLSLLLLVAGGVAATQLNQELLPSIEFPQSVVLVQGQGLDAEAMRDQVTLPIEEVVQDVDGVVNVESTTSRGVAFFLIRSAYGEDQEAIRADLQAAIAGLEFSEAVQEPEFLNFGLADLPIVSVSAASSTLSPDEFRAFVEAEILPELADVQGVANVEVSGGQELPEEMLAEVEGTPETEADAAPTPEPVALPARWIAAARAEGETVETTADLTPELVETALRKAPRLLEDLTPELVRAAPLDIIHAIPAERIAELDPAVQDAFEERLAASASARAEATATATATATAANVVTSDAAPAEGTPEETRAAEEEAGTIADEEEGQPEAPAGDAEPTEEELPAGEPDPVALPESWIGAAQAQGMELATTADLTPAIVGGIASFAPDLLADLTPEMVVAMPLAAVAALPPTYLATLDEATQQQLQARQAATPQPQDAGEEVPLPESWVALGVEEGLTLTTTADLNPVIVAGVAAVAPTLLEDLTPAMLGAMPADALAELPADYFTSLDEETLADLTARMEAAGIAVPETRVTLPEAWQQAAQAQGLEMRYPEDVTPEIMQGISGAAPQLLEALTAEQLRRFAPEVLAWLPTDYTDSLDPNLRAELDERATEAGGLGAEFVAAEEAGAALSAEAPPLGEVWRAPSEQNPDAPSQFQTAADLINNDFAPTAAEFLNLFASSGRANTAALFADLSPEVVLWLNENEPGFLESLSPAVLRLLAPATLAVLPEPFYAGLDPALREELEGIAAGTRETFVPEDTITRVNGRPSLAISVFKESEANTVEVSHGVFAVLDALEAEHDDLEVIVAFEQAGFIEESISGVVREGALGALFAVLIILLFLSGWVNGRYVLSWRSTLVTAVSIPLSILMAFAALRWLPPAAHVLLDPLIDATRDIPVLGAVVEGVGQLFPLNVSLNIMSLSGMTVAIGRVVDDSIVVLENIYRHIQRGDDQRESVLVGTRDVAVAIFASTVTTVVVFLPIGLIGGLIGEFFMPFGVAVSYALLASFLVAVTTVPVFAYLFIRKEHLPPEGETALQRTYTPLLAWALRHRVATLGIAALLFAGSLWLLAQRPRAFIPELGEVQITVTADLPDENTMGHTLQRLITFEEGVDALAGLGNVRSEIGSGGLRSQLFGSSIDPTLASIQIGAEEASDIDALTAEVRDVANAAFGEENVTVAAGTLSSGGFGGFALVLSGDQADLAAVNDEVITALGGVEGLANASSNLADANTILRVDGRPAVRYTGEVETEDALGVTAAAKAAVESVVPPEITVSEGFESQQQTQGFAQAGQAILISIVAVYVVMVLTFGSLINPFTILFSLPMAIIGAAVALWAADRVLGLSAMIGLMMLVGIVVTNAIVLIDRVQSNRTERGMDIYDALIEAGRTRLRPILMTAIAAMLALLPLALGFTEGAIIAAELATVVIGGLLSSTLLTLLVVPVMYSLLNRRPAARRKQEVPMGD